MIKNKFKLYIIFYTILFLLLAQVTNISNANQDNTSIKIAFITDLNLYPTPTESIREKSNIEKEKGLLVFESQAILIDIIKLLNEKIKPDITIFNGNSISTPEEINSNLNNQTFKANEILQLFLDMVSELKCTYLINIGINENNENLKAEINKSNKSNSADVHENIWTYKIKNNNVLLLGISDEYILNGKNTTQLSKIIKENKNTKIILITHKQILSRKKDFENIYGINRLYTIIKENKNIKLVTSGDSFKTSKVSTSDLTFLSTQSPIQYPCTLLTIEIKGKNIIAKQNKIPMKGIIKKAKASLKSSNSSNVIQVKELLKKSQIEKVMYTVFPD